LNPNGGNDFTMTTLARIKFNGELEDISKSICEEYSFGEFISNKIIPMGYEDLNFILNTSKGKYFVKVFASFRNMDEVERYVEIMETAIKNKVQTPKIIGSLFTPIINRKKLRLVVMEYIDGKTLYETNYKLNDKDIRVLARETAKINKIKRRVKHVYDSWAIINFEKEFSKTKKYLTKKDLEMILPLAKAFKALNIETLPHCLAHGDIIKTNVMRDKKGKLWIIDFGCTSNYPRIQGLSVMACNIFFSTNKKESLRMFSLALLEYQKKIKLTKRKLRALPTYIRFAHAMHIIGASYEKGKNGINNTENKYWLAQGRLGLKQTLF
jgi:Ser/Thr protein kinase RdoA (MazF antagonist)